MAMLLPLTRAALWQLFTRCFNNATLVTVKVAFGITPRSTTSIESQLWDLIVAAEHTGRILDLIGQCRLVCPHRGIELDVLMQRCMSDLSRQSDIDTGAKDVFLSHHSADTLDVIEIGERLLSIGIKPWLDQWHLRPGTEWQKPIEEALATCRSAAIFLSAAGWGKWHEREMRIALDRNVSSGGDFIVVPVLLPGVKADVIPSSLSQLTWVKFPESLDDKNFARLVWALNGGTGEPSINLDGSMLRRIASADAPGNIPTQPNALIGREQECRDIERLFEQEDVRLVTVLGPGGIGKTRLVMEIATRVRPFYAHGAYFVDIAQINDADLVAPAIASVLGVEESGSQSILQDLCDFLEQRDVLLVLDNFEQVVKAAHVVTRLLSQLRNLRVLVTSRTALNIEAERQYVLGPLAVPALLTSLDDVNVEQLAATPAVHLFVERAKDAQRSFVLTSQNAKPVAEICCRLGGLPLALVLAAARIKLFKPQQLIDRLKHPLDDLENKQPGVPDRHRKLRATIDWSFNLLDVREQQVLAQLGVFAGGATVEAFEQVCTLDDGTARDLMSCLDRLLDSSLIQRHDAPDGEPRFSMLTTLQEYAHEIQETHGQMSSLRQRHAKYYLELVEQADLIGAAQTQWLKRLDAEHDNLLAAVSWKLGQSNPEAALRFGAVLARFWRLRGYRAEGRHLLSAILDKRPLTAEAYGVFEPEQAIRVKGAVAATLNGMAYLLTEQSDFEQARPLYEESLALYRALDDAAGAAFVQMNMGIVALDQLDYAQAQTCFEDSLILARTAGDLRIVACDLNNLGIIAQEQADMSRAETLYTESLMLTRKLGLTRISAMNVANLGLIAYAKGDDGYAQSMYAESLRLSQELGDESGMAHALANLGWVLLRQGKPTDAGARFVDAHKRFIDLGEPRNIAECQEGLAGVAVALGEYERAVKLCGAADALRKEHQVSRPPDEEQRFQVIYNSIKSSTTQF